MGIRRGPNIVRDGLVLALDAANPTSYPGSGVIWKDQTINQNDGTLINGPTFSSANNGSIVFDGVNDYITVPQSSGDFSQNLMTTEHWVRFDSFNSGGDILLMDRTIFNGSNGIETFILGNPKVVSVRGSGALKHDGSVVISTGVWYHICIVFQNTIAYIYINGQLDNSGTITPVQNSSHPLHLGNYPSVPQYNFNGNWATLSIYNRALSSSEVLQNYNALKGRFGL